ncbi:vacuolar sorting protein 39 domain 1-domain-containing protein [Phakopsora pachyrhizi]|uniref:Vacuolar sorting protein 39 domain 1-domain-containing protein n=1 Tax=Phakopsora pachyrhizi TaxID=170000 RepID=A0AAV0AN02_PHAPC|nr:vacuolar sorting protein 39 domain 1-domain-containing protein [Phakopsora pachyrhizi]
MGHLLPNLLLTGGNPLIEILKKTKLLLHLELLQFDDLAITEITDLDHLVQIAKIIDTSLFKCYLAFKPTMLGPLCRLPNWCKSDEVETLLTEAKRHCKLLDLYHDKPCQSDCALSKADF